VTQVLVYPKPAVSIIVTGDELREPGEPLRYGQVYESNSYVLKAVLAQWHIAGVTVLRAEDSLEVLTEVLGEALKKSDLVFLTGGISVGDYDFVLQATINNGVQQLFHKIRQRPAKPLFFGKKGNRYIFGLPGNPASGLTAFYEYVAPALSLMSRHPERMSVIKAPLAGDFQKAAGLTHFLKGFYDGQTVTILGGQESFRLSSFARANCLIQIDEAATQCAAGEMVEVHLLPG
jgi:molybdopterin molybdotransferase